MNLAASGAQYMGLIIMRGLLDNNIFVINFQGGY